MAVFFASVSQIPHVNVATLCGLTSEGNHLLNGLLRVDKASQPCGTYSLLIVALCFNPKICPELTFLQLLVQCVELLSLYVPDCPSLNPLQNASSTGVTQHVLCFVIFCSS